MVAGCDARRRIFDVLEIMRRSWCVCSPLYIFFCLSSLLFSAKIAPTPPSPLWTISSSLVRNLRHIHVWCSQVRCPHQDETLLYSLHRWQDDSLSLARGCSQCKIKHFVRAFSIFSAFFSTFLRPRTSLFPLSTVAPLNDLRLSSRRIISIRVVYQAYRIPKGHPVDIAQALLGWLSFTLGLLLALLFTSLLSKFQILFVG